MTARLAMIQDLPDEVDGGVERDVGPTEEPTERAKKNDEWDTAAPPVGGGRGDRGVPDPSRCLFGVGAWGCFDQSSGVGG
ncbi:hypothetical protein ACWGKS_06680 [Nocardiopsis sp. NPDC055879]